MTLFRYKNGLLYTLAIVSPPKYTGSWLEAKPYRHAVTIKKPVREDFVAVALHSGIE